jgi:hypothetical protein
MTTFTITPGTSVRTTAENVHAFKDDTAAADTLIVEDGAHLITDGEYARGAFLANSKQWKVTVAGDIDSLKSEGLALNAGNSGTSTVTVTETGLIGGGTVGVALRVRRRWSMTAIFSAEISQLPWAGPALMQSRTRA